MQALLGPGDELLVLSPHWMAIPNLVSFAAGAPLPRAARLPRAAARARWSPADFAAALRAAMRPETRGVYLNTPNNPTGAVLGREQLAALAEVAIERDLWVLSDEAYEHLLFDGAKHVSIASLPRHGRAHGVGLHVLQELRDDRLARGLRARAAARCARCWARGSRSTRRTAQFAAVQAAALAAVTGPQDCVEAMRARRTTSAAGCVVDGPRAVRRVRVPVAARGVLRVPGRERRARRRRDAWALVERVARARRRGAAGRRRSVPAHAGHVRVSLAARREDIVEGVRADRGSVRRPERSRRRRRPAPASFAGVRRLRACRRSIACSGARLAPGPPRPRGSSARITNPLPERCGTITRESARSNTSSMVATGTSSSRSRTSSGMSLTSFRFAAGNSMRADAGAVRGQRLLAQAAHREHLAAQAHLAGHRDVVADRPVAQHRRDHQPHRDARRRTVLGDAARREVDVDVGLLEQRSASISSASARERTYECAACTDSFITSPSWPVSVTRPLPGMRSASTTRISPPAAVHARPIATPTSSDLPAISGW